MGDKHPPTARSGGGEPCPGADGKGNRRGKEKRGEICAGREVVNQASPTAGEAPRMGHVRDPSFIQELRAIVKRLGEEGALSGGGGKQAQHLI